MRKSVFTENLKKKLESIGVFSLIAEDEAIWKLYFDVFGSFETKTILLDEWDFSRKIVPPRPDVLLYEKDMMLRNGKHAGVTLMRLSNQHLVSSLVYHKERECFLSLFEMGMMSECEIDKTCEFIQFGMLDDSSLVSLRKWSSKDLFTETGELEVKKKLLSLAF